MLVLCNPDLYFPEFTLIPVGLGSDLVCKLQVHQGIIEDI